MGAPKFKIIPKKNKSSKTAGAKVFSSEELKAQNEQDKKLIKVYIDKVKSKIKSDKDTQKKAALIIENLLKK